MHEPRLDKSAAFTPISDVVSCELDGGAALLDLRSSSYFKLNSTASAVWSLIEKNPQTIEDLVKSITDQFEVEPDRCAADLEAVLSSFLEAELIEQKNAAKAA